MKISASIYSQKDIPLHQIIQRLDAHNIDFYHIDCNDNPAVFDDIAAIRKWSKKPIDLHIISDRPEQYFDLLAQHPVEFVTFQYENLKKPLLLPGHIPGKKGLAVTSDTSVSVFEQYSDFDFILIMATTPGQSGGRFDKKNFRKIRAFQKAFPAKKIHVDGGVNAEISFLLRNMGVYSAVSGSYLFKSDYIGAAMLHLKGENFPSHFQVKDFMTPLKESPVLMPDQHQISDILKGLDDYGLGLVMLSESDGSLHGIITNADIRKGLLRALPDLNAVNVEEMINKTPIKVNEKYTVSEMLHLIKAQKIPISYLPVVDEQNKIAGTVTFFNLIKGEL